MPPDFYIGYLDRSPAGLGRFARRGLLLLATLLTAVVCTLVASQRPVPPGRFEFGVQRPFEGILEERPLPILHSTETSNAPSSYLLVGFGKHGLPDFARGYHGQRVRFRGTLIEGGGLRMIEMNDAASFAVLDASPAKESLSTEESMLGEVVLVGELVDTKCYAGVMRPAVGKIHRACAVRCLRGGVPPGLLIRNPDGTATVVLLTGPNGAPLQVDAQWAARALQVRGQLSRRDEQFQLAAVTLRLADEPSPLSNTEPQASHACTAPGFPFGMTHHVAPPPPPRLPAWSSARPPGVADVANECDDHVRRHAQDTAGRS